MKAFFFYILRNFLFIFYYSLRDRFNARFIVSESCSQVDEGRYKGNKLIIVQRLAEVEMVLPDVPEAMQRCKRNEMSSGIGIALAKHEVVRPKLWKDHWAELACSTSICWFCYIVRKRLR